MIDTQKQLVKYFVVLIVFSGLALFAMYILGGRLNKLSQTMSEQRTIMEVFSTREDTTSALRVDASTITDKIKLINQAIPQSDDLTAVVASLESAASQSNLTQVLNFSPLNDNSKGVVPLEFAATLNGNLANFISYLERLEKLPYVIKINNLDLSGSNGFSSQGQFQINASVYVRN